MHDVKDALMRRDGGTCGPFASRDSPATLAGVQVHVCSLMNDPGIFI